MKQIKLFSFFSYTTPLIRRTPIFFKFYYKKARYKEHIISPALKPFIMNKFLHFTIWSKLWFFGQFEYHFVGLTDRIIMKYLSLFYFCVINPVSLLLFVNKSHLIVHLPDCVCPPFCVYVPSVSCLVYPTQSLLCIHTC